MIEVSVESVRIKPETQQRVLILQTLNHDRYLFIWIAHAEAYAIAIHLKGTQSPRPLGHDLMKSLVETTGARVLRVVISDVMDGPVYIGEVVLDVAGTEVKVDARPSDAVALALRTGSPIFVAEHVLDKNGFQQGSPTPPPPSEPASAETGKEQTQ